MPVHNADVAAIFEEIADRLEISGENPFRIRAYRNAARTVQDLGRPLREMAGQGEDLTAIPGVGKDLAAKIEEILKTGTCAALEKLRREMPSGITDLLNIPGLGPKRVKALCGELKIENLAQLAEAAQGGRIRNLAGFGEKIEKQILDAIQRKADTARRFSRAAVTPYAEALLAYLGKTPGVTALELAGSYRRARETVGDLDILASAEPAAAIMQRFVEYDEVARVLAHGETRSSVALRSGLQVDVRVVPASSFGAAWHYFTGSKAHNIAVRRLAQQKKLKLNEYGLFKGERAVAGRTEAEVFKAVGLPFIPPELREDRGEIEAARRGALPDLVGRDDIRGDLHMHSTYSDGQHRIEEMAAAARRLGCQYIAITDHSKRLTVARGLDEKRLRAQMEEIDRLNGTLKDITILKGNEVDILEDGRLDLPDVVLRDLDVVIVSVHSQFKLSREKQTERVLRALDNPWVTLLAHPTGRLVLSREPYEIDMERVIRHAAGRGCFLELNSHPQRLDLIDVHCQMARAAGVKISIGTDSHSTAELGNMIHGVGQARRGWLTKDDVVNTRPLKALRALLKSTRR
jgi:DNA polymerase (family 10)